ncbi:hypothetical protein D3C85_561980 [compost metagenome]
MLDQVGVERQDHERQVRVHHPDIDREVGVEDLQRSVDQPHALQEAIEQAVVAEDAHPGVHADQNRRPGRHHDQQQVHQLHFLVGAGDGIGHRIAEQQTQEGAEEGHLQRAEVGGQVQIVLTEEDVVAQVDHQRDLVFRPGVHVGVRRNRDFGFGKADLQDDDEGQQEEHEQPDEGHSDDEVPALGQAAADASGNVHERNATPLSSSHHT